MRHESSTVFPSRPARRIAPALMLCLALLAPSLVSAEQPAAAANAAVVATWNEIAVTTVTGAAPGGAGMAGPTAFNYFAFTQIAIYNAVVGITGEYELYRWNAKAPKGASPEAAAAAAAHRVLHHYFGTGTPFGSAPIGANLDARLADLAGPRSGWRAEGAGHPLRHSGRGPHHRPPRERRSERGGGRSAGNGGRATGSPTPTGIRCRSRQRGSARSHRLPWTRSIGSIPAPRRRSARPDATSRSSRRCVSPGTSTRPLTDRSLRDDADGEVLLRRGHHRDAARAAGLRAATRARHRRQRPDVRGRRHRASPTEPAPSGTPSSSTCGGGRSRPSDGRHRRE